MTMNIDWGMEKGEPLFTESVNWYSHQGSKYEGLKSN